MELAEINIIGGYNTTSLMGFLKVLIHQSDINIGGENRGGDNK